jgi:hypothetical protein
MIRWGHRALILWFLCSLFVVASAVSAPKDVPSGTISLSGTSVAAGVGAQWGDGRLRFKNGKTYRFFIEGLEVGGVGFSNVQAQGKVYNLRKVSDLEGVYVAGEANAAVGVGAGVQTMRNEHGVVINLSSHQKGLKLTLGGQGVRITLKG